MKKTIWRILKKDDGFTMIELLMVVLLIAILAVVAVPQFIDFQSEAKTSAANGILGAMRVAISNQKAQMIIRCGANADAWPALADVTANDITTSNCTTTQVPNAADRKFTSDALPPEPFGNSATITTSALSPGNQCDGTTYTDGYCYNATTGEFWINNASGSSL